MRKNNLQQFVVQFTSVQSLSPVWFFEISRIAACQASLSFTISQSTLKLMSIELVMPSNLSSSVVPFSSHFQSFPASGSFTMSQLFTSGGQNQIPWGFSVLLLNPQVGKSVVGPRTFPTGQEPLSYNCSPVCGSSASNRDLLQEDL